MSRFEPKNHQFHLLQDSPTIRTTLPKDDITDAMVQLRVKIANLTVGDRIIVQAYPDNTYTTMLCEREYRVTNRQETVRNVEDTSGGASQQTDLSYAVEGWSQWRYTEFGKALKVPAKARAA